MRAETTIPVAALLFAALFALGFFLETKFPGKYLGFLDSLDLTKNPFK